MKLTNSNIGQHETSFRRRKVVCEKTQCERLTGTSKCFRRFPVVFPAQFGKRRSYKTTSTYSESKLRTLTK